MDEIRFIEWMAAFAPSQCVAAARRLLQQPHPAGAVSALKKIVERHGSATFPTSGFAFPAVPRDGGSISGGVWFVRAAPHGEVPDSWTSVDEGALSGVRAVDTAGVQHRLPFCALPAIPANALNVDGDSSALALGLATRAHKDKYSPAHRIVCSGLLAQGQKGPEVRAVTHAAAKLQAVADELAPCHFFICTEEELPPSQVVEVHRIAVGTPLKDVLKAVRKADQVAPLQAARFVPSPPKPGTPLLDQALDLPVRNARAPSKSFRCRVVFDVPFDPADVGAMLQSGEWTIPLPADFSWFGKMRLPDLGTWTQALVPWHDDGHGPRPAVLLLDMSKLASAQVLGRDIRLASVDLLPILPLPGRQLSGPGMAKLGLVFEGGPCTVRDLLEFVGARQTVTDFKLELRDVALAIGDVVQSIVAAIRTSSAAMIGQPAPRGIRIHGNPWMWQTVHFPFEAGDIDPALRDLAWNLISSFSQPKPGYPKAPNALVEPGLSPSTDYGLHDRGGTFAVYSHDDVFNLEQKPRILMESHYLHHEWAQRRSAETGATLETRLLNTSFQESHHRRYYAFCERRWLQGLDAAR